LLFWIVSIYKVIKVGRVYFFANMHVSPALSTASLATDPRKFWGVIAISGFGSLGLASIFLWAAFYILAQAPPAPLPAQ
jgi:hypothetical protein